jgi:hypothetical protein
MVEKIWLSSEERLFRKSRIISDPVVARGIRATDQKALSEGTTLFPNEKHIPMKHQLVRKN